MAEVGVNQADIQLSPKTPEGRFPEIDTVGATGPPSLGQKLEYSDGASRISRPKMKMIARQVPPRIRSYLLNLVAVSGSEPNTGTCVNETSALIAAAHHVRPSKVSRKKRTMTLESRFYRHFLG